MNEFVVDAPSLTEPQRVVDVFAAPSKTFTDLLRKSTFWGPLLITILVGVLFSFSVQQKVGWEKVTENNMHQSAKQQEQWDKMPSSAREITEKVTAGVTYGYTVMILIFTAIITLLVWVTVNFGFGGKATFGQVFAVYMYSNLVVSVKFLLAVVALFAGVAPDSFLLQNPVGTNVGYYLGTDVPKALSVFAIHLDLFELWSLVLTVIGVSIVAKVSRGKAAASVVGWWLIIVLVSVAAAAAQS
jgi:hypothetical protein